MKNLTLAFLLVFASSIAYGDDLTEYGELVSIERIGSGSDLQGLISGRVTLRVNDIDTVYTFGTGYCSRSSVDISALHDALLAPYMRVRFRTKPENNPPIICLVGFEVINEKFLVQ